MDKLLLDLKNNRKLIISCVILIIIFLLIYYFVSNNKKIDSSDYYEEPVIDKYEANMIIPVYMTEEDIVKKYLNDYKNNVISNVNDAYFSLNKEYRNKKFGSLEKYKEYINKYLSLATYSMEVDSYNVTNSNGKRVYNVYDKSGNRYIFKENSIMNYEVYLDDSTVEIK